MLKAKVLLLKYQLNKQSVLLYTSEELAQKALVLASNDSAIRADFLLLLWRLKQTEAFDGFTTSLTQQAHNVTLSFTDNDIVWLSFFQRMFDFNPIINSEYIKKNIPVNFTVAIKQKLMRLEMKVLSQNSLNN